MRSMTHVVGHMGEKNWISEIMFIDEIDHINEISNLDEMIIWMKLYIYL